MSTQWGCTGRPAHTNTNWRRVTKNHTVWITARITKTQTTVKSQPQMTKTQIHFQKPIKHRETTIAAATEGADEQTIN